VIALGYSEPDSGSDVASAKTTAVRVADGASAGWVINGQKMFTSTAQVASHVFVLARTNTGAPKHKGLTLFLVPTDSPGFELRPIHTLGGQVTNATFYSGVQVPDSARIGEILREIIAERRLGLPRNRPS
jgi:alkylation response protein AidB-like acyl-CoA dehydrogenase